MSSVVLRCPHCGTTRTAPGECEACHEAQVRYYCTAHTPGRWLESPACPQCGARFGERTGAPVRPAASSSARPSRGAPDAPPARPSRDAPAAPAPTPPPGTRAGPRTRTAPEARPRADEGASRVPRHRPPVEQEEIYDREERAPRGPSLADLLRAVASARRTSSDTGYDRAPPTVVRRSGGCLGRFIMIMVVLFLLLTGGVSLLGGSLLRLFMW